MGILLSVRSRGKPQASRPSGAREMGTESAKMASPSAAKLGRICIVAWWRQGEADAEKRRSHFLIGHATVSGFHSVADHCAPRATPQSNAIAAG